MVLLFRSDLKECTAVCGKPWPSRNLLAISLINHYRQAIDMAKKATTRGCPTCKVVFPTIYALNDHYKETSHIPQCVPRVCKQVGIQLSVLIDLSIFLGTKDIQSNFLGTKDIQSNIPLPAFTVSEADASHSPFLYKCEPCNKVFLFKIPSLLYVRIQLSVLIFTA